VDVISDIREYVSKDLMNNGHVKLDENLPLIEAGYLTSLQTVDLVLFLEQRFQIEIDPEEVNEDNFRSLASISSLVQHKMPPSNGSTGSP